MWQSPHVVGQELTESQYEVVPVEHEPVVETLSAKCPDHSLDDRVRIK
jgi:hypothetical protein